MKRSIFIAVFLVILLPAFAQKGNLVAFKVAGDVCVLRNGEWTAVAKRDSLSMRDIMRIRPDSRLAVLEQSSSQIYYMTGSCEGKLASMISDAKRQADRITGLVNQQIRESIQSENDRKETYAVTGVAYRGGSSVSQAELVYASLYDMDTMGQCDDISAEKVYVSEDEFYFRVRNDCPEAMIVNIMQVSGQDGKRMLCFNVGYTMDEPYVMVPPESELDMSHYVFCDGGQKDYILFAASVPYDTQELRILLASGQKPGVSKDSSVVFSKISSN